MTVTTNSKSQEAVNTHIVLARPINGVALNGIEFLLNEKMTASDALAYEDRIASK